MLLALPSLLAVALASYDPDISGALQNILKNTDRSTRYQYPTDFTRGIIPVGVLKDNNGKTNRGQKAFHSHNDYWRDVPYYFALSYGAMSVEADVWLINETLYVSQFRELAGSSPILVHIPDRSYLVT
jgi:hypothetical protein